MSAGSRGLARSLVASLVCATAICVGATRARAQASDAATQLEEARFELEEARFEDVLATLEQLEAAGSLDLSGLGALLELRAIAQLALADDGAVDRTLRALASIDPTHTWTPMAPPDLRTRYERLLPGTPRVAASLRLVPDDVQLTLSVELVDPALLVRSVELFLDRGAGFEQVTAPVALPLDADMRAYARALGPGRVLLAGAGSEREPQRVRRGGEGELGTGTSAGGSIDPWPFVVAGAAVVVVAVVVTIVVLAVMPTTTQPSSPVLR